uniref:Uncharacterized protein n=1 Tax=Hyaloperonospora arabidopsidis (strain Emoy2) TaxID=559515 RepID=M4BFQ7_HYAAE
MVIARFGCVVCPDSYESILFVSSRFLKSHTKRIMLGGVSWCSSYGGRRLRQGDIQMQPKAYRIHRHAYFSTLSRSY